jgi:hypothetical protein
LKHTRAIVWELLASSDVPVEYEDEDESKDEDVSGGDNLDQIAFNDFNTL